MALQPVAPAPGEHSFGVLLRMLRRRAGLSQGDLAVRSKVSERTVRNLETGRARAPHRDTARLLADALEISGPEREAFIAAAREGDQSQPDNGERAPAAAAPAQLPADIAAFVGRAEHLRRLDAFCSDPAGGRGVVLLTGTAGVGKTALAVHWAHRVRAAFPDGQLYADLRGFATDEPLESVQVLARFLRALGVRAQDVPTEPDEAAALYRTRLAGRRVLIVLDNASDARQVRPLVPGTASCLVLVTSRSRLIGLVARDGATMLGLDVLSEAEAVALLERIAGQQRAAEPAEWVPLSALCARLPLALRIAAAYLYAHPRYSVAAYAERLQREGPLAALDTDGDGAGAVRAAFGLSYAALDTPSRCVFRRLGLVPGPDVTPAAAAALMGWPLHGVAAVLERLAAVHLVDEHRPGRYRFHDLLRRYSSERCAAEEDDTDRQRATQRLLRWYLAQVDAAAARLYPHALRLPRAEADPPGPRFGDGPTASAWLDAERPNLIAAISRAATDGPRDLAWQLADGLRRYFSLGMHTVDWRTAAEAALTAAEAEGDQQAWAAAAFSLAQLHWSGSSYERAIKYHQEALTAAQRAAWQEGQASIVDNLGIMLRLSGRLPEAAAEHRRALVLSRRSGQAAREAVNLCNLAVVSWEQGALRQARAQMTAALRRYRAAGSPSGEALALGNLGDIYFLLGEFDIAREHLTRAIVLHREVGDRSNEADALRCLAALTAETGDPAEAARLAETALGLARDAGHRRYEVDTLITLVRIAGRLGRYDEALKYGQLALALAGRASDRYPEAAALVGLTAVHAGRGELDEAFDIASRALAVTRAIGYRLLEGEALICLSEISLSRRRHPDAIASAEQAVDTALSTGHRVGQLRARRLLAAALKDAGRWREAQIPLARAAELSVQLYGEGSERPGGDPDAAGIPTFQAALTVRRSPGGPPR